MIGLNLRGPSKRANSLGLPWGGFRYGRFPYDGFPEATDRSEPTGRTGRPMPGTDGRNRGPYRSDGPNRTDGHTRADTERAPPSPRTSEPAPLEVSRVHTTFAKVYKLPSESLQKCNANSRVLFFSYVFG